MELVLQESEAARDDWLHRRWPGNVEPLKPEETDLILRLTWGSWDWLVHSLATGTAEELREYFPRSFALSYVEERAKPAAEREKKFTLDVEARDAVPVYLDCSTGKILVSFSSLDEAIERYHLTKDVQKEREERDHQDTHHRIDRSAYMF